MAEMKTFKQHITEAKDPDEKIIAKFEELSKNISKYAHRWGENPSARMYRWVDTYNDLKQKHRHGAWLTYCKKNGYDPHHDAGDNLA